MATALSAKAVGSSVYANKSGERTEFVVIKQGRPSTLYDESCNGTWLLEKNADSKRKFDTTNQSYKDSDVHSYLNGSYLNKFVASIRNAIKQVKIPYYNGLGEEGSIASGSSGLSTKVFLLSAREVGWSVDDFDGPVDGAKLDYFDTGTGTEANTKRICYYSGSTTEWWTRTASTSTDKSVRFVNYNGRYNALSCGEIFGVRPAFIIGDAFVDDSGNIFTNEAPTAPPYLTVPSTINGGSTTTITWGTAADADGNLSAYVLERSVNSGTWTQLYSGAALSYTDTITKGWSTVAYRVKAVDTNGAASAYKTSPTVTINNNTAPTITSTTASGTNLGTKNDGFDLAYTVADAEADTVTVTEYLDDVAKRTYTATLGQSVTIPWLTAAQYQKVLNGSHTVKVIANDGKVNSAAYTVAFTKKVTTASITLSTPLDADDKISAAVATISGSLPDDAVWTLEVTNNAKDPSPVWEDATESIKNGSNHLFTNTTAANGFAFNFRFNITRGDSDVGGYINSIGGAFE